MRSVLIYSMLILLVSCGNEEHPAATDSVADIPASDTVAFTSVWNSVAEIPLPVLVDDKLTGYSLTSIDNRDSDKLLPAEFDFTAYQSVHCFARTMFGKTPALWFRLESAGEYEEASDVVDLLLVFYDCDNTPLDVCNVASNGIGFSYSYVRVDSVFMVEMDEMENINVTTSEIAVTEKGFVPAASETKIFDAGDKGYKDSRGYADSFLSSHGMSTNPVPEQ